MSSIFCRLYCPLKTTNFCSSVLLIFGAHIIHIDEGERKLAISITKHNFLPSPFTILRHHNSIISFLFLFIVSPILLFISIFLLLPSPASLKQYRPYIDPMSLLQHEWGGGEKQCRWGEIRMWVNNRNKEVEKEGNNRKVVALVVQGE